MTDAYAKEFEKWLQGSKKDAKQPSLVDEDSLDTEDSTDEVDTYQSDKMMKDRDEQAPILFNNYNGNAINSGKKPCFQDEPPILEPVGYTTCPKLPASPFYPQIGIERQDKDFCDGPTQIESDMRKYETYIDSKNDNMDFDKCLSTKTKESGNLFDKFGLLSGGDDFPPPLIPSHEAHLTTVDAKDDDNMTEKSYATLQNLSPNFCAMEADSTSEVFGADQNETYITFTTKSDKTSKAINNDACVECDSTCMLGASPHVVSPGSVSLVESDNFNQTPSHEEFTASPDGNPTLVWNDSPMEVEKDNVSPAMSYATQTGSIGVDHMGNFISDHQGWDRECPKLEAVIDVHETKVSKKGAEGEDPPVLCVVPKTVLSPSLSARRKRHTIDSVESFTKRKQKSHSDGIFKKEFKHVGTKSHRKTAHTSSQLSDDLTTSEKGEAQLPSFKTKDEDFRTHSKSHSRPRKRRKRCQTLSIVDLVSYSSHLPPDLHSFVVGSTSLSILQNRMHRLMSLLFPELSSELNSLTPGSSSFEVLLNDLFKSLKELEGPTKPEHESELQLDSDSGRKLPFPEECVSTVSNTSVISHSYVVDNSESTDMNENSSSKVDKMESSQCVNDVMNQDPILDGPLHSDVLSGSNSDIEKSDLVSEICATKPLVKSNSVSEISATNSVDEKSATDSMIPRLSELSLTKETERVFKNQPAVLIPKNPSALYKNFVKLSCRILQLLLPDLDVTLSNELADSPHDLLYFIDSVIASNSM